MRVIGTGFLGGHLTGAFGDRYAGVTAIAAGVSSTAVTSAADYDREAALVYDTARHCRAHGRLVVFFSTASAAMYGAPGSPGTEDGPVFPPSAYGRHKLSLEAVLAASGVDRLVLRLSHVVGTGQPPHQLLPSLVAQVRSGSVTVHRGATRDLVDVRDFLVALDGLLAADVRNTVVNIASGVPEPAERIIAEVEEQLGVVTRKRWVDGSVGCPAVSVARLAALVPSAVVHFGPDYPRSVLRRHVPTPVAASLSDSTSKASKG